VGRSDLGRRVRKPNRATKRCRAFENLGSEMDILSQREALIADLNDQLVSAEDCPNQVEGAETLPYDMFREYQMYLVLL